MKKKGFTLVDTALSMVFVTILIAFIYYLYHMSYQYRIKREIMHETIMTIDQIYEIFERDCLDFINILPKYFDDRYQQNENIQWVRCPIYYNQAKVDEVKIYISYERKQFLMEYCSMILLTIETQSNIKLFSDDDPLLQRLKYVQV